MDEKKLKTFLNAAHSLKLYRRAELSEEKTGQPLIDKLYVDPLPGSHVFNVMVKPNTAFLIGRKGTGKSTIFQRVQHEIRNRENATSVYLDIKTIYESSQVDEGLLEIAARSERSLSAEQVRRLFLFKSFLLAIVVELKTELRKRIESSFWERLKQTFSDSLNEVFEGLDSVVEDLERDDFESILGLKSLQVDAKKERKNSSETEDSFGLNISQKPGVNAAMKDFEKNEHSENLSQQYSDLLIRVFKPREMLEKIRDVIQSFGIRHLYIFVDDFSELPEDAMKVVVDLLIAPFNNWSDEFIKFKIAAYPNRIYFGQIDKTKIDEIHLDIYRLYGTDNVSSMEEKAIDFTKRLIEARLDIFGGENPDAYFDLKTDLWRALFYATAGNPRALGYLLFFLHESNLIYGKKINASAINDAARRYYEDKVEPYFGMSRFLHESFSERASVFSLKELLESIVVKAKELQKHKSAVIEKIEGRPPTSHFHVIVPLESLIASLELNFFLTKYYEMSDRNGRKVSVYALNFGLCQKYSISYGRPTGQREFRAYFVERIFDYSSIMEDFLKKNQEIVCNDCGEKQGLEKLEALKIFDMLCPACRKGRCNVINLSKKYEALVTNIQKELLLPASELGILQVLHEENEALAPAAIAEEMDCSYQLVGKRGKILEDKGLVDRSLEHNRRFLKITKTAEDRYFMDDTSGLNLSDVESEDSEKK